MPQAVAAGTSGGATVTHRRPPRAFVLAGVAGSVFAAVLFALLLSSGSPAVLVHDQYGNFYDAQARALLAGHLDVPARALYLEGFRIHGKTYTYFGLWPAVLRMPVLALAPGLAGRLTRSSMLLGFGVFLTGVVALHGRIRTLLAPERPYGAGSLAFAVAVPLVAGCGTAAVFLASRAWVYHEAILWGIAWSVVAYERLIAFTRRPTAFRLVGVGVATAAALASRVSLGFGVVGALLLVAIGIAVRPTPGLGRRWQRRVGAFAPGEAVDGRRWLAPVLLALLVPVALYAGVNRARFGTLFSVPWQRQVLFLVQPHTAHALRANGGTYFGIQFAPTTLLQYLRPDALGRSAVFPWVTFPRFRPTVVSDAVIDMLDHTSSVPSSMPALLALTVLAYAGAFRTRLAGTGRAAALRAPLLGALGAITLVTTIAFVAERYLGDFVPLLVLGGVVGAYVLWARLGAARSTRRRVAWRAGAALLAVLALTGVWVNLSLGLVYQRLYNPHPDSLRTSMLRFQYGLAHTLHAGAPQVDVASGHDPGSPAPAGTLRIVGGCDALYWSDGDEWQLIEAGPRGGVERLRLAPPPDDGDWHPVESWGGATTTWAIGARRDGADVRLARGIAGTDGRVVFRGWTAVRWPAGRTRTLEVATLRPRHELRVRVDGDDVVVDALLRGTPVVDPRLGVADAPGVAATYGASQQRLASPTPFCHTLLRRLGRGEPSARARAVHRSTERRPTADR
jgi:hypothetical protein